MKKLSGILCALLIVLSLFGCSKQADNASQASTTLEQTSASDTASESESKILIAYFSWSGNTKEMAEYIAEQTGGDLLELEPQTPYPTDYNETGDIAKKERDENARPEIANLPNSLDEYDTVFIGYPIWWHTAPMIIGTFLESYDLTEKDIYPFAQSGSMNTEQFENSMSFVKDCAKSATVHDGLFVKASDKNEISNYLKKNSFIK